MNSINETTNNPFAESEGNVPRKVDMMLVSQEEQYELKIEGENSNDEEGKKKEKIEPDQSML